MSHACIRPLRSRPRLGLAASLITLATAAACGSAHAMGVYAGIGLPGLTLGLAVPATENITVRADYTSVGNRTATRVESGITYDARLKAERLGVFADWYPFGGRFRLTAGATSNDVNARLAATGVGKVVTIGSNSYTLQANDRFDATIGFPRSTPYLGIGWGHRGGPTGLGFHADIGAAIGRATVATSVSGNLALAPTIAADVAAEEAQLRENVRKIRFIPQISMGVDYRF